MKVKRGIGLSTLLMAAAAVSAPSIGAAGVVLDVDVAPPAPRVEVVPVARPGFVWAPGFWPGAVAPTCGCAVTGSASAPGTTGFRMSGSQRVPAGTTYPGTG